jgi:hypothetical protein
MEKPLAGWLNHDEGANSNSKGSNPICKALNSICKGSNLRCKALKTKNAPFTERFLKHTSLCCHPKQPAQIPRPAFTF